MKERFLNVLKWFLIVLGVLFLIQLILIVGFVFGMFSIKNADISSFNTSKDKEITSIVKYIDKYKQDNGAYPQDIKEAKLNKNYEYNYELSKDKNCYTISLKSKKNSSTKQYQECSTKSDNSFSYSQVLIYNN